VSKSNIKNSTKKSKVNTKDEEDQSKVVPATKMLSETMQQEVTRNNFEQQVEPNKPVSTRQKRFFDKTLLQSNIQNNANIDISREFELPVVP
jgi:hypothetical protein